MDRSWLTIARNLEAYTTGINLFLDQAVANGVCPDTFRYYKNAWWRHHGEKNIGEQNVAIGEEEIGDEVAGPRSPGKEIDVYMHPLIDKLNELWEVGTPTYDAYSNQSFTMKDVVLWTINDFPAYEMLSGWSTHGYKACSHCMHDKESIYLPQLLPLAICPVLPKAVPMNCLLEKIFPPAFFDIIVHLPVHLADEAALAGPIEYRWMYPIEQYLQMLKHYVRNKGRPEGSIAEAYLVDECLSFCSMYLRDVESRRTRKGRNEDGIGRGVFGGLSIFDSKGCYMGSGENVMLDLNVLDRCHRYILNNCDEVHPFRRFRIKSVDDKHKNQNCGVFVLANVPGAIGQVNCYGRVVDMFEVKYYGHAEPGDRGQVVMLFKCEWVNSESPRGMKTDQYGFTMVNFNRLGFKEDPFILALQAFYVEDTVEKDWHVVV
ncbi:uncharacterized protein [Malus domestica]|uniref:uncharacterized protein n=1 Tax=Malus domestica TaxID=3750 RepID=UPI0039758721